MGVHPGWRADPEGCVDAGGFIEQLARCPEVTDIGHTGADKDFVHFVARDVRQQPRVVRIVGAADNGFLDVGQIDFQYGSVLGIGVGFHQ